LLAASVAALAASSARDAVASDAISVTASIVEAVIVLASEAVPIPAVPEAAPAVPLSVHVMVSAPPNGARTGQVPVVFFQLEMEADVHMGGGG
jgi:hypothetical protein